MVASDELETGRGANQVRTLQRVGDTQWSSHFHSICSLMRMFHATCTIVKGIIDKGASYSQRGDAFATSKILASFEFIFILHLIEYLFSGFHKTRKAYFEVSIEALRDRYTHHQSFEDIKTLSELCQRLTETEKSKNYHLIDRLIHLILTLSVSTTTTERAFSAMKIVKTRLRNKMNEEFLADNLVVYIEKDIASLFNTELIIDEFESRKYRRTQLS
ncbi:Uncharacterized protein TCM_015088 [Theobroma cacao]|uniref:HAT C-terminal dimerisation domain-containing protein n=1 Tax=Theobroma cacao TaxID=3641 RepID=A0A061G120_THECC|nr:Uncharacterized protein TCM_015088 [Theobroma cacao]